MKGPIMHSPASKASTLWRWMGVAVLAWAMILSPLLGSSVEARTKSKAKPSLARKSSAKPVATKKHAKRAKKSKARVARKGNPAKLVMPESTPSPVLDVASQYLGSPYRFGASSGAYDCSGFVRRVFEELGVDLPHSAREQFSLGDTVHREELAPGDLVFFRTYRRDASHVGIYVGDDKFIHAATRGGQVQVDSLNQQYYSARYLGARRIEKQS